MNTLKEFSVQEFSHGDNGDLALELAVVRVMAMSPEEASSKALGETLFPSGDPRSVRAKAWFLDDDGRPLVTMLYSRDAS